jgi:hypothetical protein
VSHLCSLCARRRGEVKRKEIKRQLAASDSARCTA